MNWSSEWVEHIRVHSHDSSAKERPRITVYRHLHSNNCVTAQNKLRTKKFSEPLKNILKFRLNPFPALTRKMNVELMD